MTLFINTTDFHNLHLALISKTTLKEFSSSIAFNENYKTNELVEKFLKKEKVKPQSLKKVVVCSGPGSFTGIRVGVSLAQALGFALNIPVVVIPKNKIPKDLKTLVDIKSSKSKIDYGQKPNISTAKKK